MKEAPPARTGTASAASSAANRLAAVLHGLKTTATSAAPGAGPADTRATAGQVQRRSARAGRKVRTIAGPESGAGFEHPG
ncbi:hypothetical protein RC1_0870 [Rhodospirillum centenum SW]|uniref:Uncharacterized protein n=1 Tax=Rhodospirillum centenum (strain ATCC 51521 / SW) TaxID=414684 RepID=B6IS64_RHOCS|nr:hypothetical protein RC1_0870 [Rhodospirillum centenum SW]